MDFTFSEFAYIMAEQLYVTQHILFLCQKVMKEIGPILRPVRWLDVYVSAMMR